MNHAAAPPLPRNQSERPVQAILAAGAALLFIAVAGLAVYKWGGSYRAVEAVRASGRFGLSADAITLGGVWSTTVAYFARVWPALFFGLVIGALVRATVSPRWVSLLLGGAGVHKTIAGGFIGAPLMLCSCCVAPLFSGAVARGARLGPALALMMGSPGLNVAALVLTFLVLPPPLGVARLVGAAIAVFGVSAAVGRAFGDATVAGPRAACAGDELPASWRDLAIRIARSFVYLTVVTVPLIVAGVAASSVVLPAALEVSTGGTALGVMFVAMAAVLIALPTFFEIPLAMTLLALGAPAGAAAAFLVAGPIVNLPSLFVLARETRPRVAAAVAAGVWLVAVVTGLVV